MIKKTPIVLVALAAILLGVGALLTINYETIAKIFPQSQTAAVSDFSSNLILHYTFDGGTASDSSGNGRNGTVEGATATTGKIGGALSFDGVDDFVSAGDVDAIDGLSAFTVSTWVKPNSSRPAGSPAFISKWDDSFGGQFILYYTSTSNACDLVLWGSSIVEANSGGTTCLEDTNWHHVVAVYDGSTIQMYIDTRPKGDAKSLSGGIKSGDGHDLLIGKSSGSPTHQFAGAIDDVRIYNRALTPAQIGELYNLSGDTPPAEEKIGRAHV